MNKAESAPVRHANRAQTIAGHRFDQVTDHVVQVVLAKRIRLAVLVHDKLALFQYDLRCTFGVQTVAILCVVFGYNRRHGLADRVEREDLVVKIYHDWEISLKLSLFNSM